MKKRELIGEMPHDAIAEQAVLGRLLDRPEMFYSTFAELSEEHFLIPKHKFLFSSICKVIDANGEVTETSVYAVFKNLINDVDSGGFNFIISLSARHEFTGSEKEAVKILRANLKLRKLMSLGLEISAGVSNRDYTEVDEFVGEISSRILSMESSDSPRNKIKYLKELAPLVIKEALKAKEQGVVLNPGLKTGFKQLDEGLGGLAPGRVTVLAGTTSSGKSALAAFFGLRTAIVENTSVGLISLEMSAKELTQRIVSTVSGVEYKKIINGTFNQNEFKALVDSTSIFEKIVFGIDDSGGIRISELRAVAKRLIQEKGLKLLIVDFLQLVKHKVKSDNSNQRVAEISQAVKEIALHENIHVLLLSQLSRRHLDRPDPTPRPSDLRDSGSIEQDADAIIFIMRPTGEVDGERLDGTQGKLIVAKNRSGKTFDVDIEFTGETFQFRETLKNREVD
jgi:replicative DNA helicase